MSGKHALETVRGSFIDITRTIDNPEGITSTLRFIEDGLLFIKQGKVEWFSEWKSGKHQIPDTIHVRDYRGELIVPDFVDTHIHYPQSETVGAYGEQSPEWLNKHAFPTERRYEDLEYAREMSAFFIKQLLCNRAIMALVFDTIRPQPVDALFKAASHISIRMITSEVMMDHDTPNYLLDTAESSYHQSKELVEHWHKNGHLLYVIIPRFAPTSSPEQMVMAQRPKEEYPNTWVHTHLCESRDEIAQVKLLYPDHDGYLDVYHQYGLTGKDCVSVHCVHLGEKEWDHFSETKFSITFYPTSDLYLGDGLFNLKKAWQKKVKVGIGTDIGAGTIFNMLQMLSEAYEVLQLQGYRPSAYEAFYLATLGGAKSLGFNDLIGNFLPGKETGFAVMEPIATPLQQLRHDNSVSLVDKLFVMMALDDDRSIYRTRADGHLVYGCN